jgi:hypothetical protein
MALYITLQLILVAAAEQVDTIIVFNKPAAQAVQE